MTPSAQISAVIELLISIQKEFHLPADSVANRFFRQRRYIGGSDRRFISDQIWSVLRSYRKVEWWLKRIGSPINPRMIIAAHTMLTGSSLQSLKSVFSGEKYAPLPLSSNEILFLKNLENKEFLSIHMPKAVKYEIPDWVYPFFEKQLGDRIDVELTALLEPAHLDLRVNTIKTTLEDVEKKLSEQKFNFERMKLSPWGLRLKGRQSITLSDLFTQGYVEIQDEGSQLIAIMTGVTSHMRVLDYCAGAGGKTLAMAMMMVNKGNIIASDVSTIRLNAAQKRFKRAGVFNIQTHLFAEDAKWIKRRLESFDRVLVDAPCSGTGTWRRNPDARLSFKKKDLDELIIKQAQILNSASKMVKKGGRLLYATCSLLQQENQDQINQFLEAHKEFTPVYSDASQELLAAPFKEKTFFQLTPAQYDTEGFYCAILEKKIA